MSEELDRFNHFAEMQQNHDKLLHRRPQAGSTAANDVDFWEQVGEFIVKGRATGAILGPETDWAERYAGQNILDYWANELYRVGGQPPDPQMVKYDPTQAPILPDEPCPYRGLMAFDGSSSAYFFGRQTLIQDMVNRIQQGARLLFVVGVSGSGKSSLVQAGLLPTLKTVPLPEHESCRSVVFVPGARPTESLARARDKLETASATVSPDRVVATTIAANGSEPDLTAIATGASSSMAPSKIIVVDQFEEIFTLCRSRRLRNRFVEQLLDLVDRDEPHMVLILTLRKDFEDDLKKKTPELYQRYVDASRVDVRSLLPSELQDAIVQPAARVGLKFEDGVVDDLIGTILKEDASLPLLQFTLLELWNQRDHNRITWPVYSQVGNPRQALKRGAEEFFDDHLTPQEQKTVKTILLKMVHAGQGHEFTSRRVPLGSLITGNVDKYRVENAVYRLACEAHLIKFSGASSNPCGHCDGYSTGCLLGLAQEEAKRGNVVQVEVAHEALVRNWPALDDWLEIQRERRRWIWRAGGAGFVLFLFIAFGVFFGLNQMLAMEQDNEKLMAGNLASEAMIQMQRHPELGLWLAREAYFRARQLDDKSGPLLTIPPRSYEDHRRTLSAIQRRSEEALRTLLSEFSTRTLERFSSTDVIEISPNGIALARGNRQGGVQIMTFDHNGAISSPRDIPGVAESSGDKAIAFDATSERIAVAANKYSEGVAGADNKYEYTIWMLNAIGPSEAISTSLQVPSHVRLTAIAFDGNRVAVADSSGTYWLWNPSGSTEIEPILSLTKVITTGNVLVSDLAFVNTGSEAALLALERIGGTGRLRIVLGEVDIARIFGKEPVTAFAINPQVQKVAVRYTGGEIAVWDGKRDSIVNWTLSDDCKSSGASRAARGLALSSDGEFLAANNESGVVCVWILPEGELFLRYRLPVPAIDMAFAPGNGSLITIDPQGDLREWKAAEQEPLVFQAEARQVAYAGSKEPSLLTIDGFGRIRSWDRLTLGVAKEETPPFRVEGSTDGVRPTNTALGFSADGQWAAFGWTGPNQVPTVHVWPTNLNTQSVSVTPTFSYTHTEQVTVVALNADGTLVASGDEGGNVEIWAVAKGKQMPEILDQPNPVTSLVWSPKGKQLALSNGQNIYLWNSDFSRDTITVTDQITSAVTAVALSSDGRLLAIGHLDGGLSVQNLDTRSQSVSRAVSASPLTALAFDAEANRLAIGGSDGLVRLRDVDFPEDMASYQVLPTGCAQSSCTQPIDALVFSDDGLYLVAVTQGGAVMEWSLDVNDLASTACWYSKGQIDTAESEIVSDLLGEETELLGRCDFDGSATP
jgi:WD40 repeat protein